MNRIEKIRKRLDEAYYEGHELADDISFLLSRIDIADDALDTIEDQCNDPFDVEIAEKALAKIRE